MAVIRDDYVAVYTGHRTVGLHGGKRIYKNWFVASCSGSSFQIRIPFIVVPKELVGKRVRFKIEVVK